MVRVLGIGVIVLALISILPAEGMSLEKREGLAYADTAQLNLSLGRRWPVLKLDSLSSISNAYIMVGLEKANSQRQALLRVEDPIKQTWIGLDTVLIGRLRRDEDGKFR